MPAASATNQTKAISLPNGILGVKVLSITALVTVSTTVYYPPNIGITGAAYQVYVSNNQIIIQTDATSSNVNNKSISILITYEQ